MPRMGRQLRQRRCVRLLGRRRRHRNQCVAKAPKFGDCTLCERADAGVS